VTTAANRAAKSDGAIGSVTVGTPQEAETRHHESPQDGIAGADEHFEQVTGNSQVSKLFKPLVGPCWDPQWKLELLGALEI